MVVVLLLVTHRAKLQVRLAVLRALDPLVVGIEFRERRASTAAAFPGIGV